MKKCKHLDLDDECTLVHRCVGSAADNECSGLFADVLGCYCIFAGLGGKYEPIQGTS
jgi:hypothetical protein